MSKYTPDYDDEYYDEIPSDDEEDNNSVKQTTRKAEKTIKNTKKNNIFSSTEKPPENDEKSSKKQFGGDGKELSYNPYEFVSKCCKAFLFYDKTSIYCSHCGKEVEEVQPGKSLSISINFNSGNDEINLSGDILRSFHNSIPRFATDPTCELCEKLCPKCHSQTRYLRDCCGDLWYVCSNKDCRTVISPNDD